MLSYYAKLAWQNWEFFTFWAKFPLGVSMQRKDLPKSSGWPRFFGQAPWKNDESGAISVSSSDQWTVWNDRHPGTCSRKEWKHEWSHESSWVIVRHTESWDIMRYHEVCSHGWIFPAEVMTWRVKRNVQASRSSLTQNVQLQPPEFAYGLVDWCHWTNACKSFPSLGAPGGESVPWATETWVIYNDMILMTKPIRALA